jgi:glycopeptide antibiotics resistance protein
MFDIFLNYFKTINVGLVLLYFIKFLHDFLCKKYQIIKDLILNNNGGINVFGIFKEFVTSFLNYSSFNQTEEMLHEHYH